MLNAVESFAGLSLKVVAVRAADNSDFKFEFPDSAPPKTATALTAPLQLLEQPRLELLADTDGWHHGGINE